MTTCESWEKLIEKLAAGTIDENENKDLQKHLSQCAGCRQLVKIHTTMEKSTLMPPVVEAEEFFQMRQKVLSDIRTNREKAINWLILWQNIKSMLAHPALGYATAAVLLAALIFNKPADDTSMLVNEDNLVHSINQIAAQNTSLSEVRNSPYSYSDISIRQQQNGSVLLGFNLSTRVTTEARPDDPIVRELLAQSLVSDEPISSRLRAIKYSESLSDSKVQEALTYTVLNDQNAAVRLKAMNALTGTESNESVREIMLHILQNEKSVQMRLLAIDYLTRDPAGQNLLRQNLYESDTPVNPALLIRASQNKLMTNQNKE